jgi:hypothetical protein
MIKSESALTVTQLKKLIKNKSKKCIQKINESEKELSEKANEYILEKK